MLNWVNRFSIFSFLNNCDYHFSEPAFECLVAAGEKENISLKSGEPLDKLYPFFRLHGSDWIFGHLGYELMSASARGHTEKPDGIGFEDLYFYIPEIVLKLEQEQLLIFSDSDPALIYQAIMECPGAIPKPAHPPVDVRHRLAKDEYITIINALKQHILRGDCYEINFCQEFYAAGAAIDPLFVYHQLNEMSPNPFSVFYRNGDRYCCCASPERFLSKTGNRLFSQPIKGTSKRDLYHSANDESNKQFLLNSPKEKSENVMVVDLVRNDLSRVCKAGSVRVDELFGLYSFPQVHQMISTVSGELQQGISFSGILNALFPMGSMTGAPKIRVMQLIDQYEKSTRGLFSGSIGYFKPTGNGEHDFDFNVVIRSLLYNASTGFLSFQTGSGITYYCEAEKEYEECLLKAAAILKIVS